MIEFPEDELQSDWQHAIEAEQIDAFSQELAYLASPITRALIIRKPWIDLILDNGKCFEMRSIVTSIRGKIGLIEAGSGLVVGEANLDHCHEKPLTMAEALATKDCHQVEDMSLLEKWCFAWCLTDVKRFETPMPYSHPKGAVIWVNLEPIQARAETDISQGFVDYKSVYYSDLELRRAA